MPGNKKSPGINQIFNMKIKSFSDTAPVIPVL
jgi:hypothetical protein